MSGTARRKWLTGGFTRTVGSDLEVQDPCRALDSGAGAMMI